MEWLNIIITGIVGVLGALGGGGLIYIKQTKRGKDIDNELREADAWRDMYGEKSKKCDEKDGKIDELRKHINTLQEERIKLLKEHSITLQKKEVEMSQKNINIMELEFYKCMVCGCKKRRPPREIDQDGGCEDV